MKATVVPASIWFPPPEPGEWNTGDPLAYEGGLDLGMHAGGHLRPARTARSGGAGGRCTAELAARSIRPARSHHAHTDADLPDHPAHWLRHMERSPVADRDRAPSTPSRSTAADPSRSPDPFATLNHSAPGSPGADRDQLQPAGNRTQDWHASNEPLDCCRSFPIARPIRPPCTAPPHRTPSGCHLRLTVRSTDSRIYHETSTRAPKPLPIPPSGRTIPPPLNPLRSIEGSPGAGHDQPRADRQRGPRQDRPAQHRAA